MARLKPSRRAAILTGIVVALVVAGVLARHVLVRGVLEGVLSLATGYEVRFGDQRLGFSHAAFFDVRVRKNGDPVLDAARVDVNYVLRDIFPGGDRRFGFVALSIQRPVLTITRHTDGSLTFAPPPGENGPAAAAPPPATRHAVEPLYFTARLRDGVIRFIDQKPLQPDLATQSIVDVSVDASVKSDARTTARIAGVFVSRPASGAALQRYPLEIRSLIDEQRGLALTRFRAAALPVRGLLAFLVHTHAVRFDGGVLNYDAHQYTYAYTYSQAGRVTNQTVTLHRSPCAAASHTRAGRDLRAERHVAHDDDAARFDGGDAAARPRRLVRSVQRAALPHGDRR